MVSADEAMRGAFLCWASEAAQVAGEDDPWSREYESIRSPELDLAVVDAIVGALAQADHGRAWQPWQWVRTEAELRDAYVLACADQAAVVFYQGDPRSKVAGQVVSTPAAARLAARLGVRGIA